MKLFRKKRLQIQKEDSKTIIRWWRLNGLDLILAVLLPMHVIWGVASANGSEEVLGMQVISLGMLPTVVYWVFALLLILHLAFNRIVCLVISPDGIHYSNGRFPRISRTFPMHSISNVQMKEKAENIAESAIGEDLTSYHLYINSTSGKRIRIKGLSENDIEVIRTIVSSYRSVI